MKFLVLLLLAHIIGDFLLQPDNWVKSKFKYGIISRGFWKHIGVHFILLAFLYILFPAYYLPLIIVGVSHIIIDAFKILISTSNRSNKLRIKAFIIDQLLHVLVILIITFKWSLNIEVSQVFQEKHLWILFGYIFLSLPSATIIKELLSPYEEDIEPLPQKVENNWRDLFIQRQEEAPIHTSLENGGKYIGIIERLLIFTFILIGQWTAVGLLITAKSVFRFGDLNQGKNRQFTEYVLIGTLLSFSIAIFVAILVQYIITHY